MDFRLVCATALLLLSGIAQAGQGYLRLAREVSSTAQMPQLETTPLPPGAVELRIWLGFGVVVPNEMLRLRRNANGRFAGELLLYFPSDLAYMEKYAARFRRGLMTHCSHLRSGGGHDVCTQTQRRRPNWGRVYKELVQLGVTTLPDDSTLPPPELVMTDGFAMFVEVRQGAEYRSYSYSNPAFRDGPEARAAEQIARVAGQLFDH